MARSQSTSEWGLPLELRLCMMLAMRPVVLETAASRAMIAPEAGGRLHQLEVFDGTEWLELLYSPDLPDAAMAEPLRSGCFPMAPWPNRIAGGRLSWDGRVRELPTNLGGHAIHGTTFVRPWTLEYADDRRCRISVDLGDAWPWRGRVIQELALDFASLQLRIEVHSDGEAFPAGAGWHPYFRRDIRPGAEPRLRIEADEMYETRDMIPTGELIPVSGAADFRDYPPVGARRVDVCYREPRKPLRVCWGDVELSMESCDTLAHAVVFTAGHAICLEPQTCAIDAFNLHDRGLEGTGTAIVEPGRPLVATCVWRWTCNRAGA